MRAVDHNTVPAVGRQRSEVLAMADSEQITEPETPDELPANYVPPIPAPKTRAEFSNLSFAPRSTSCRDVENVRRLLSWQSRWTHGLGFHDSR